MLKNRPNEGKERPGAVVLFRSILFLFLLLSSSAILYGTAVNTRAVRDLAETAMESAALTLSTSAESALRSGGSRAEGEVRNILSDRVVAYAMVARKDWATAAIPKTVSPTPNARNQPQCWTTSFGISIWNVWMLPMDHAFRGHTSSSFRISS